MNIKVGQIWQDKEGALFEVSGVTNFAIDGFGSCDLVSESNEVKSVGFGVLTRSYTFVGDKSETEGATDNKPDMVNKPPHYKDASGIECKEITCHRKMPFSLGNAIKYLYRAGSKGDKLEDLKKAEWYLRTAFLNDEKTPKAVKLRLQVVADHREGAVKKALIFISHNKVDLAYQAVKQGVEAMEVGDD